MRRRISAAACAVLAALALLAAAPSPRSTILLRYECSNEISRREITLFANGTVRLREKDVPQTAFERSGLGVAEAPGEGELRMYLGDLSPEDFAFYLGRLRRENLSETEHGGGAVVGEWVETCVAEIALPGEEPYSFRFGRYDSMSLALSRVLGIAEELSTHVVGEDAARPRIPTDYQPRIGDVLQHRNGNLYEVRDFTTDDQGLELQGVDQPLTLYVMLGDLRAEFRALVSD